MTAPAGVDDVEDVFRSALQADAAASAGGASQASPDAPPPPRKPERDPDAPHGRDDDGKPLAPYGYKADGTPRIKPGGPGRAGKDDKPRVTDDKQATSVKGGEVTGKAADYIDDLMGLGNSIWFAASMIPSGRVWRWELPDIHPYCLVWHESMPELAAGVAMGAASNKHVRRYVSKLSGDESWSWVLAVGIATIGLVNGCVQLAQAGPDDRATAAEANAKLLEQTIKNQLAEVVDSVANVAAAAAAGD